MSKNNTSDGIRKDPHSRPTSIVLVLALTFLTSIAGLVGAFAILYPVVLSDTVDLTDSSSLRQAAEDLLDLVANISQGTPVSDDLGTLESPATSSDARETVGLSDSAQAVSSMYYQVSASSVLALSDSSSSGSAALDELQLQDNNSLPSSVQDALSAFDSTARMFAVLISDALNLSDQSAAQPDRVDELDVGRDDDRGTNSKPNRIVRDSTYFSDRPLGKTEITNIDITDLQGNVLTRLVPGQELVVSLSARNYQNIDQDYVLFVQVTDARDIAVQIMQISGSIMDGESTRIEVRWNPEPGTFFIKAFISDGGIHPAVISESLSKTVIVS